MALAWLGVEQAEVAPKPKLQLWGQGGLEQPYFSLQVPMLSTGFDLNAICIVYTLVYSIYKHLIQNNNEHSWVALVATDGHHRAGL